MGSINGIVGFSTTGILPPPTIAPAVPSTVSRIAQGILRKSIGTTSGAASLSTFQITFISIGCAIAVIVLIAIIAILIIRHKNSKEITYKLPVRQSLPKQTPPQQEQEPESPERIDAQKPESLPLPPEVPKLDLTQIKPQKPLTKQPSYRVSPNIQKIQSQLHLFEKKEKTEETPTQPKPLNHLTLSRPKPPLRREKSKVVRFV